MDWFNVEKEYVKAMYCPPGYLTYMQSTSCKMHDWITHKLESRLLGEISTTSGMQMITTLMAESEEDLKCLLMKMKEEREKSALKLNIKKTKIMASGPITSWQIDGETMETVRDFFSWAPKSLQILTAAIKLKRHLLLGRKVMTNLDSILTSKDILCQQMSV